MSSKKEKKEKKSKSEKNTPAKEAKVVDVPSFIMYTQINIGNESIDASNVQQLLSERAQCKIRKEFERADAIARSLQGMKVSKPNQYFSDRYGFQVTDNIVTVELCNVIVCAVACCCMHYSLQVVYHDEKKEWYVKTEKPSQHDDNNRSSNQPRTKQQERNRRQAEKLRKPKRHVDEDEDEEDDLGNPKKQRV